MRTRFYPVAILSCAVLLLLGAARDAPAVESPFKIQIWEGQSEVVPPYRLISGKTYRLQVLSLGGTVLAGEWFLAGDVGRITAAPQPTFTTFTAVFVGEAVLICRVDGVEQRVKLNVVPMTRTLGPEGGQLEGPMGVKISLPTEALDTETRIGVEIVRSPGLPLPGQQLMRVVQISPVQLVLKKQAELTFVFGEHPFLDFLDIEPHLYFWEPFSKTWLPVQGRVNRGQGSLIARINHFGIYTVMVPAPEAVEATDRLQIQNVNLSPRVFFAPEMHRLTITYRLNAPEATQVFVTMDIFSLHGRRVRRLFADAPHGIGANVAQWDGLTDDGVLVRNGRYVLLIQARIGAQRTFHRKLIVVFK